MIEVLMAGTILAMSTFMVVGLLKLSDEMSYRAKVDAKLSQIMKTRATTLVNMSFESMRQKVAGKIAYAPNSYSFTRGGFTSTYISDPSYQFSDTTGNGFPFIEATDPFSTGPSNTLKFLLSGKPLPGDAPNNFRDIFPFVELINVEFKDSNGISASPATATRVQIFYAIWWINEFVRSTEVLSSPDFDKLGAIQFDFIKYDPTSY